MNTSCWMIKQSNTFNKDYYVNTMSGATITKQYQQDIVFQFLLRNRLIEITKIVQMQLNKVIDADILFGNA